MVKAPSRRGRPAAPKAPGPPQAPRHSRQLPPPGAVAAVLPLGAQAPRGSLRRWRAIQGVNKDSVLKSKADFHGEMKRLMAREGVVLGLGNDVLPFSERASRPSADPAKKIFSWRQGASLLLFRPREHFRRAGPYSMRCPGIRPAASEGSALPLRPFSPRSALMKRGPARLRPRWPLQFHPIFPPITASAGSPPAPPFWAFSPPSL